MPTTLTASDYADYNVITMTARNHADYNDCKRLCRRQHWLQETMPTTMTNDTMPTTLQYTATHCNTLQHTARDYANYNDEWYYADNTATHCKRLRQLQWRMVLCRVHCNALQHTVTHCNTLQHTATYCKRLCRQHSNTRQHTATHGNTLQHTATHCNTINQKTMPTTMARSSRW